MGLRSTLSAISIDKKLVLMVAMPVLISLYLAGSSLISSYKEMNEMEQLIILSEASTKLSAMVHELQKERGMTAGYLGISSC